MQDQGPTAARRKVRDTVGVSCTTDQDGAWAIPLTLDTVLSGKVLDLLSITAAEHQADEGPWVVVQAPISVWTVHLVQEERADLPASQVELAVDANDMSLGKEPAIESSDLFLIWLHASHGYLLY
jgi:hypothetical protein